MNPANFLTIFLFIAFLSAPIGSLAVLGYSPGAQDPPLPSNIEVGELLGTSDRYRKMIAAEMLSSTPVGVGAIKFRSYLDYYVFGHVNAKGVVSGSDGWLYYKPEFLKGKCLSETLISRVLSTVEAMRAVAKAAGINLYFSVSPDKSVVHPEYLSGPALAAAGCKLKSAALWRAKAIEMGSSVIDHLAAFRTARKTDPLLGADGLFYPATGTHWNDYGKTLAMGQLASIFMKSDPGLPLASEARPGERVFDLMRMLRLEYPEISSVYPSFWSGPFRAAAGPGVENTLIIHDSFYAGAKPELQILFPSSEFAHVDSYADEIAQISGLILVNSVERVFFDRVDRGPLSWDSQFGRALLAANKQNTQCEYSRLAVETLRMENLDRNGDAWVSGRDPQIYVPLERHPERVCVRFTFTSSSRSISRVFLPLIVDGKSTYRSGMDVDFSDQRQSVRALELILSAEFSGKTIRLDPISDAAEITSLTIEVGKPN